MNADKLLERLSKLVKLEKQDAGEFNELKIKMVKSRLSCYRIDDWGTLSTLESRGMGGLMQRNMLVINSLYKDIPVFVVQYISLLGRHLLEVDILDTMKEKRNATCFVGLEGLFTGSTLKDRPMPEEWYTPMLLPGSGTKKGRASGMEKLIGDMAEAFVKSAIEVHPTNGIEGRMLRLRRMMDQLYDHGGFTYDGYRVCLKQEKTEEMFDRWVFCVREIEETAKGACSTKTAGDETAADMEKAETEESL